VAGNARAEFVEFERGGITLRGMLHFPAGAGPAPGVVILHGFTGNRIGNGFVYVKTSRALAAAGIASLRFDFAGSGESEGRFEDMSVLTELEDARAGLEFLSGREGVDPARLGVLGHSVGGFVAAMLLEDARLSSGVLCAPVADKALFDAGAPPDADEQLDRQGYVAIGPHRIGRRFGEDAERADPLGCLARSRADVLIMHGEADETVPPEHARMLERAAAGREGARTELAMVPEADHGFTRLAHREELIRRTVEWFASTLGARA
jgi:dipeptidyl aminopeptidase/acylaminoacyl peptidase